MKVKIKKSLFVIKKSKDYYSLINFIEKIPIKLNWCIVYDFENNKEEGDLDHLEDGKVE